MVMDLHVHTRFSCDSDASMEEYCKSALRTGLYGIAFTEHIDFNPADEGNGFYEADRYFSCLEKMRTRYGDDLKILAGLEFSEPHVYPAQYDEISKYPYDFIIGSVHWVGDLFPSLEMRQRMPSSDFFAQYWAEVQKAVAFGKFDSLGHIDFPKRYCSDVLYDTAILEQIFLKMVENDISLEINTSSLRKGLTESMPDSSLLALYKKCGGCRVTIGSDAHFVTDLAADYEYANRLADTFTFQKVYYENRKPILIG